MYEGHKYDNRKLEKMRPGVIGLLSQSLSNMRMTSVKNGVLTNERLTSFDSERILVDQMSQAFLGYLSYTTRLEEVSSAWPRQKINHQTPQ